MHTLVTLLVACTAAMAADGPYLFQSPTMNKTHVVFMFAGDLWTAPRTGGVAVRLTSGRGAEGEAHFSPDGSTIAFTGEYDGNVDVFTIPASGGVPKRLTSHPETDHAAGWTPDGKRVLFMSTRETFNKTPQLYSVAAVGGFPERLPFPMASGGAFSPDGSQIAYMPLLRADTIWKRYRGGRASYIWIGQMADSSVTAIPRKDSNDYSPMWIGNQVYFLSDRNQGKVSLFKYDVKSKQVSVAIDNKGLDFKSATAGPDGIVLEQFGSIQIFDLKTGKLQPVPITLSGDLAEVRPRMEKLARFIQGGSISPSGVRAAVEARGEIFTAPVEKGNARNLTNTSGIAERSPAWSPDGKWIAYFSDESGEYMLHLAPQNGEGDVQKISLGNPPSFFYSPVWSPDSRKICYADKRLQLWHLDIEKKSPVKIDRSSYQNSLDSFNATWSPDSKWIAYAKQLRNHLKAVHVYSVESGQSKQITDGMSDAISPVWDRNGKYLYMAASTDIGPALGSLDLSAYQRPVSRHIYVTVLSKADASPLAPESDEEKPAEEKKAGEKKPDEKKTEVKIDFEGIEQRTIPLPMPARNYYTLAAGKTGILFALELPSILGNGPPATTLHRFDLAKRKAEKFADGVMALEVAANGEKILLQQGQNWIIAGTGSAPKPGEGKLKTEELEARLDPRAEWKQMYKEVLRIERDFFYDPNHHGLDLQALGERYERYLSNLSSRWDLSYLWKEMLGELSTGHVYIVGGDTPKAGAIKGGLLGADYKVENGRYRIGRIFSGENWNPETRAPLTQPGVNVAVGDYLLAVNGRDVQGSDEIYSFFEGTSGKSVRLKVSAESSGANSREVTVVPIDNEAGLRRLAWMEGNRRKVEQATAGQVAYVYLPDTANGGYTYFNRFYFAQNDRKALIIDERFNGGGKAADYIIDHLRRPLWNYWSSRDGEDYTTPATNIPGPKVMMMNEYAGSGGDMLPWLFRRAKLGPLVGKRTWGGLVGIGGYPTLMDGGTVTAPHFGFWNPDGKWEVENYGTAPDIEVELDPKAWREGRDTQLERAIAAIQEEMKKNPAPVHKKPAYPVYHTKTPIATTGGAQ
ncbi:MAG: PD40 domain-containing protein [Bryobacterales bacterium]|nr:PD40 domain-containing protein [Bryobacterales bacterium]